MSGEDEIILKACGLNILERRDRSIVQVVTAYTRLTAPCSTRPCWFHRQRIGSDGDRQDVEKLPMLNRREPCANVACCVRGSVWHPPQPSR